MPRGRVRRGDVSRGRFSRKPGKRGRGNYKLPTCGTLDGDPLPAPIHHWPLNVEPTFELPNDNWVYDTINIAHLLAFGTPVVVLGDEGYFNLDGVGNALQEKFDMTTPEDMTMLFGSNFDIVMDVFVDENPSATADANGRGYLFGYKVNTPGKNSTYLQCGVEVNGGSKINVIGLYKGVTVQKHSPFSETASFTPNRWSRVRVRLSNDPDQFQVYVNGSLALQFAVDNPSLLDSYTYDFVLGGPTHLLNGKMRNVRIFQGHLTEEELLTLDEEPFPA